MITRLAKGIGIAALVGGGWLAVLAITMRLSDDAPAALVLFPDAGLVDRLPEGAAIVALNPLALTVTDDAPGLTALLYRAGATLVLPAGLAGCIPRF